MRNFLWLLLCGGLYVANLSADSVQYSLTSNGGNSYTYQYFLNSSFTQPYEVLDVVFDASYTNVTNASVLNGASWSSFILNPAPGDTQHDYYAEALVSNPPLNGTFAVTFTYSALNGDPSTPGSQAFMFEQFDSNGNFVSQLSSGLTTQQSITDPAVPEPSSVGLSGMMLAGLAYLRARRNAQSKKVASK